MNRGSITVSELHCQQAWPFIHKYNSSLLCALTETCLGDNITYISDHDSNETINILTCMLAIN